MTAVDLDALDKLRGALRRDANFWMQADRIADALLPVVDRIASERAAAELREARNYVYGYGVRDQVVIGYLTRRADVLDPT